MFAKEDTDPMFNERIFMNSWIKHLDAAQLKEVMVLIDNIITYKRSHKQDDMVKLFPY